ncbi:MAG: hypothetical protein KA319_12500 [Ferruginibacter sp.]|nr:hypothetical protein [Ferruginibacter sp.]
MNNSLKYTAVFFLSFSSLQTMAQRDTAKKQTIDITSSYKPVLRNAVKINFSASHLNADTTRSKLQYSVPSQNLFYSYQPITLRPLALQQDTNLYLGMRNFLKLGYGNFATPYVSAGFSFGDGKKMLFNLYANYISSKGKIVNQEYAQMQVKANGSFFMPKNEFYVGAQLSQNSNYLYGYNHTLYNYKKDSIRHQFQDIVLSAGFRNTAKGEYGISYNPNVTVINFTNKDRVSESSIIANAPITKTFGDAFMLKIEGKADITSYTTKNLVSNIKISNNVFQIAPSLIISSPRFTINGGIIPTWNNGIFVWLPNVYAEAQLKEKTVMFQAGWIGRYTKNTYRNLTAINPFLTTITAQNNTKEIEYYGGIKATVGKHFSFNLKGGIVSFKDLPFFINDTATDNKAFKISNEKSVQSLRIHGDVNFVNQDKFTLTAGLTFNGYTLMQSNAKAWHTVPLEITSSLRWWAFKQVLFKADLYAFGGGNYLQKGNTAQTFTGGTDISAGVEFRVNKMFSAWLDINNIANQKYQRWHNYEVLGLNVLGGVRVNF